jgi:hypothetical protein
VASAPFAERTAATHFTFLCGLRHAPGRLSCGRGGGLRERGGARAQGAKGAKSFEKAEDPIHALEHGLPIDCQHYLDHFLEKPLSRLFGPIMKNPKELMSGAAPAAPLPCPLANTAGGARVSGAALTSAVATCLGMCITHKSLDDAYAVQHWLLFQMPNQTHPAAEHGQAAVALVASARRPNARARAQATTRALSRTPS